MWRKTWSCATNLWASHNLETALQHISNLGFGFVDLWASPAIAGHVDLRADTVDGVKKILKKYDLKPSALTLYFTTPDDKFKGLEWASELGARCIIFEPGPNANFHEKMTNLNVRGLTVGEPGDSLEQFVENLLPFVKRGEELGVNVALEVPHVYTVTESLAQVKDVLTRVTSSAFTLTLAPPHILARGGNILETIKALALRTDIFYLWDVKKGYKYPDDDRAFGGGDEQTPGNGSLNFQEILAALSASGFRGIYDVKCHGTEAWDDADRVAAVVARGLSKLESRLRLEESR